MKSFIEFHRDLQCNCDNEPDYELLTEINKLSLHYNEFEENARTTWIFVFFCVYWKTTFETIQETKNRNFSVEEQNGYEQLHAYTKQLLYR